MDSKPPKPLQILFLCPLKKIDFSTKDDEYIKNVKYETNATILRQCEYMSSSSSTENAQEALCKSRSQRGRGRQVHPTILIHIKVIKEPITQIILEKMA